MSYIQNRVKESKQFAALTENLLSGKLSHATIFFSLDTLYLDTFLKSATKIYVCINKNACGHCLECIKVQNHTHADVFTFPTDAEKKQYRIYTDDIAFILNESIRAAYGERKVFILKDINTTLDISSQNKFLKLLEEPPKNVYFLLSATNEEGILPTIKSRLTKVFLPIASKQEICGYLFSQGVDDTHAHKAAMLSDGLYSQASLLSNNSYMIMFNVVLDILQSTNAPDFFALSSARLSKDREGVEIALNILEILLTHTLQIKNTKEVKDEVDSFITQLENIANIFSKKAIIRLLDDIGEARQNLKVNVNTGLIVDRLLLSIARV